MFDGTSKRAAEKEARQLEEQGRAIVSGAQDKTVSAYLDLWLETHKAKVSFRTWDRYRDLIESAKPFIGALQLQDIKGAHI